jgi:hypothetical protein
VGRLAVQADRAGYVLQTLLVPQVVNNAAAWYSFLFSAGPSPEGSADKLDDLQITEVKIDDIAIGDPTIVYHLGDNSREEIQGLITRTPDQWADPNKAATWWADLHGASLRMEFQWDSGITDYNILGVGTVPLPAPAGAGQAGGSSQ